MKSLPFFLLCVGVSYGLPVFSQERSYDQDIQLAQKYLNQFYEQEHGPGQRGWKSNNYSFVNKIQQMQRFFKLNVTGKVDADTLKVIQQPRCGVPDVGQFVLASPGWKKTKLTYRIVNYTPDMRQYDVDTSIQKAFEVWSTVTPLTFKRVHRGRADIMIEFATRVHGRCPRHFDGPLGVLGHAFPPNHPLRGNVHLDEDEKWTASLAAQRRTVNYHGMLAEDIINPTVKKVPEPHSPMFPIHYTTIEFNLWLVAAHEIGHALGLAHSDDPRALMFPNYKPIDPEDFPLSEDDINGIQAIYGPSLNPPKKPMKPTLPKACDPKISFDAITTLRREILFLKGRHFWRVYPTHSEVDLELISTFWSFLPSNIQAAYENMNDQVFFFKDNHFWMISGFEMHPGYPKTIDHFGFPQNIKKIDAAVFDKNSGKTYFFVGTKYWRIILFFPWLQAVGI
ncbi:matrix metalloproteinase-27-like isoform X2 [Sceloporus undulatus]|uniref:matrix metalloproteinase-27-like isoform X2 n=1 Tax=Sceloporus undulatus TaxID=8520 RepID=UPI001C4D3EEE|nr:matrix metalloproteinase-27-like isoform X2 [Sceloporus undulatus]